MGRSARLISLIRPRVGHVQFMEFFLAREMIDEGYRAAQEALERWEMGRRAPEEAEPHAPSSPMN